MPEENLNQPINQAPEQADPTYKETLLLYNEQNGAVEAVSELKQEGRQYKAITTSPLTANKPAFFDLRNSSAVGAFIKGFLSQENAKPFHFLKVAADKASEVAQSLLRLADNPKDPEGLKALNDHRVTSYQLERVKFDTQDLHLQELKEMGVVVTPKELEAMKLGLPTTELHNISLKVGDLSVAGEFALRPFRDLNGDVQVGLESALARPEFEREEFRMMFTASDKEQMLSGKTPDRLYEMPNPHTGEKEWCYVTLNPATNRFVSVPKREVPDLRFFNGVRLTEAQQENLASGSRVQVEGCTMRNGDITYSGKVGFDALTREYRMTDYRYSKPYIPESLSKQLDERQLAAVKSPEGLDCSKEKAARFSDATASRSHVLSGSTPGPTVWTTTSRTCAVRSSRPPRQNSRDRNKSNPKNRNRRPKRRAGVGNANAARRWNDPIKRGSASASGSFSRSGTLRSPVTDG